MKCFFALSAQGWVQQFNDMALVLAKSAQLHTSLEMFCIYDGTPAPITDHLTRLGVTVLFHQPQYLPLLQSSALAAQNSPRNLGIWRDPARWSGTFLRLEVPLLMRQLHASDPYALYVDADTFFQTDPDLEPFEPEFLAVGPESDPDDLSFFNAGIMLLNVQAMLESYPKFIQFCIRQNFVPKSGLLDQGLYNAFYRGKWFPLPAEFNWKAYWPPNSDAAIIHFHGPNPQQIQAHLAGTPIDPPIPALTELLTRHPENLRAHLAIWQSLRDQADL